MSNGIENKNPHQPNNLPNSASTINPFSLAEMVLGKSIDWNKFTDQTQTLCNILNIPKDELFSGKCPLLTPYIDIQHNGNVVELNDEEARLQLDR